MIETKTASAIVTMAIVAIVAAPRPAEGADRREVRAIWVTRWDYVSAYDVRTAIRNCASLGLNRVYFQVRGQADAFYRSTLEPWSEELKGDPKRGGDPGYDPLAIAVTAARESGVELYAWINVLPGWRGKKPARDRRHLFHRHPEWFMTDGRGRRQLLARETDRYSLLNPCRSEVRAHLRAVVAEIARNYAIDGVQFDYLRYLRRNVSKGEDVPFDAATVAEFRKRFGREPRTLPGAWNRFRQDAMDRLVRELASAIRSARPGTAVSIAAVHDLELARRDLFQDAPRWLRLGWVDEVCPMLYTTSESRFGTLLGTWRQAVAADRLIAGIGAYLLSKEDAVRSQIARARSRSLSGFCVFSYTSCFLSRSPDSKRSKDAAEKRARMRKALLAASVRRKLAKPSSRD